MVDPLPVGHVGEIGIRYADRDRSDGEIVEQAARDYAAVVEGWLKSGEALTGDRFTFSVTRRGVLLAIGVAHARPGESRVMYVGRDGAHVVEAAATSART